MAVPARISLVTLGVTDLQRSVVFYEALGWRRSSASTDEVAFFATADGALGLYPAELLAEDARLPLGTDHGFRGVTLAINLESEGEVDRVLSEAEAAGAVIAKPAERAEWGGYSGYFTDPDGHAWEVAHNPGFPLDEDGSIRLPP